MTEFFKNSEHFCMNFTKFHNQVYEFCRSEDTRSTQLSSVVEEATHLSELRLKTDQNVRNFRLKTHPYEQHVQYHLQMKYPRPGHCDPRHVINVKK